MRKVRISARKVAHKYVELDVFVPNTIKDADLGEWLTANEHTYDWKIKNKFTEAKYQKGLSLNIPMGMYDREADEEYRYDIIVDNAIQLGGHL